MTNTSVDTPPSVPNQEDLAVERELILLSGLFDSDDYLAQAGAEAKPDPVHHYITLGWRKGFEPNRNFPGNLLRPYFALLGMDEAPLISWLTLKSVDRYLSSNRNELERAAAQIRLSALFDQEYYFAQLGFQARELDPALHYLLIGERLGLWPSPEFDPRYYGERFPDVKSAGVNFFLHFIENGRDEGRNSRPAMVFRPGRVRASSNRENVFFVLHEASRTGAPILGWNIALLLSSKYNLYIVWLGDGDLAPHFEELAVEVCGPFLGANRNEAEIKFCLQGALRAREYAYAIVNSAESRIAVEICSRLFIPTLFLMHEFGSYVHPVETLRTALDWSSAVIFPARIVAEGARAVHGIMCARETHILPQGVSAVPKSDCLKEEPQSDILNRLQDHKSRGAFIVLGAGTIQIRKGVDLFLATAAYVQHRNPKRNILFVWVGGGYKPKTDMSYSVYLGEQFERSGLKGRVMLLDEVSDLTPVYRIADLFFLSSRLDPLPNVSIDAAVRGIPIICFEEASGTASLLLGDPETAKGVVPHLSVDAAGTMILGLAEDESWRGRMSEATRKIGQLSFDMEAYVKQLDALGKKASVRMKRRRLEAGTLVDDQTFDQDMFLGPSGIVERRDATIVRYLALAEARGWAEPPIPDTSFRRPCAGFQPRAYAESRGEQLGDADPLADYVRRGKPAGDYQLTVLRPDEHETQWRATGSLRIALHAHFHYPELAGEFVSRLRVNHTLPDLFISTNSDSKKDELVRAFTGYRGRSVINIFPNKGRDVAPLLTGFRRALASYDVIGHLHAKRSFLENGFTQGDAWREFLWQNLLGGVYSSMDRLMDAFEQQESLGLVFPSDPHLVGWDTNRESADKLARKMGWKQDLPAHFDFPLGTMFWARRKALDPLFELDLNWSDYPNEPLPEDGTLLHAIERLIPFACRVSGLEQAVTHIPTVSW